MGEPSWLYWRFWVLVSYWGKLEALAIRVFVCRGKHRVKMDSHGRCVDCGKRVYR